MKLKLAYTQLLTSKRRAIWTLLGIILSAAMITAVFGFAVSGMATIYELMEGWYVSGVYYVTVYGSGAIMSILIVAVSVIVVSNAFRVSAGERMTQFGLLKSVGATKKQIEQIVVYEGVLLSAIGIPAGIAIGLIVQLIGIHVANHMLVDLNAIQAEGTALIFRFVFSWQAVFISVGVSFVTVLLSAWLPARKAAKISAIDAIRGAGEVKIKSKRTRLNWLVKTLFGIEGELASKSLKRSRRNFRATVVSLTVSIVLFIGASSFGTQLFRMTNLVFGLIDADVVANFHSSVRHVVGEHGEVDEVLFTTITTENAEEITAAMRKFPNTAVFGVGGNDLMYNVPLSALRFTPAFYDHVSRNEWITELGYINVALLTVDAENYAMLAARAGVPLGSNILINHARTNIGGTWTEFVPHVFDGQGLTMQRALCDETVYLPLHGELRGIDVPNEIVHASMAYLTVVVPEVDSYFYFWATRAADPDGFAEYARSFFWDMLSEHDDGVDANVVTGTAQLDAMRGMFRLIMTAIYGFVAMLTLIALTNVISTISANVRSRSREFAVLQSVGMTRDGLKRMLNLESILCSAKSLIFGVPLGVAVSYLIYMAIMESVDFAFEFPWLAALQCVLAVFAITWVTMRYSASRLRGGNIVEKIRGTEGAQ